MLGSHAPQKQRLLLTKCALMPTHLLTDAVKQWNSICGSDLRGSIFSKKIGQWLQRCCLRDEQPFFSLEGSLTSHTASVEVRRQI